LRHEINVTKALTDIGNAVRSSKPFMLPVYDPGRVPDPVVNAGALIIINDRSDGVPRGRLALSNGSTWDKLAYELDVSPAQPVQSVAPLVHQIVRDMLPALIPPQQLVSLPAPAMPPPLPQMPAGDDLRAVAEAILAMSEHINALQIKVHEQDQRIAYLEHHAADKSQIRIAGAA